MSVPGSRPARVTATVFPSGNVSEMSSSRRMVWLAATTTPDRQTMPLEGMRRRAWIATVERPTCSTASASSFESATSVLAGRSLVREAVIRSSVIRC
jgi:hypothetical protein